MPSTSKARMTAAALVVTLSAALLAGPAAAEPYLAAWKGMQCSNCHSHPAGGGKRTAYGNAFAQTGLAAERLGGDDAALWTGAVTDWLSVGGDFRAGYRNLDVPNQASVSEFRVFRGAVYLEAEMIPNRLTLYVDQQFAPDSNLNREAYVRLNGKDGKLHVMAGQFYLPYGLRLQDDTAFIRQATGVTFFTPDRGLQVGYESGPWSTQLSVTNGSGGGVETDTGKQLSWVAQFVRSRWRLGASFSHNDADAGNRRMQNVFAGLRTGSVVWLIEADLIVDDLPAGGERDGIAGLAEANWIFAQGHNIKLTYDWLDPDRDVDGDDLDRISLLWEYSPMQFLQARFGARTYNGVSTSDFQNRDEYFLELHGFF